jgi:hypothetical protein
MLLLKLKRMKKVAKHFIEKCNCRKEKEKSSLVTAIV